MLEFESLSYGETSLEPVISRETMRLHHGKHYKTYTEKSNEILSEIGLGQADIAEAIAYVITTGAKCPKGLIDNFGQYLNHTFFWRCLIPEKKQQHPIPQLKVTLERTFGSLHAFGKAFIEAGKSIFGSGWVWLVSKNGKLAIETTSNGVSPYFCGFIPLLGIDTWEHAWVIDYPANKEKYLTEIFKVVDWKFVSERYLDAFKK